MEDINENEEGLSEILIGLPSTQSMERLFYWLKAKNGPCHIQYYQDQSVPPEYEYKDYVIEVFYRIVHQEEKDPGYFKERMHNEQKTKRYVMKVARNLANDLMSRHITHLEGAEKLFEDTYDSARCKNKEHPGKLNNDLLANYLADDGDSFDLDKEQTFSKKREKAKKPTWYGRKRIYNRSRNKLSQRLRQMESWWLIQRYPQLELEESAVVMDELLRRKNLVDKKGDIASVKQHTEAQQIDQFLHDLRGKGGRDGKTA